MTIDVVKELKGLTKGFIAAIADILCFCIGTIYFASAVAIVVSLFLIAFIVETASAMTKLGKGLVTKGLVAGGI